MRTIHKETLDLIDVRRTTVAGVAVQAAVARQAYSPDAIVVWRGRYDDPSQIWWQKSDETRTDLFDRIRAEIRA